MTLLQTIGELCIIALCKTSVRSTDTTLLIFFSTLLSTIKAEVNNCLYILEPKGLAADGDIHVPITL